ncbi:rhodanese-like domain-containing protein [Zoogloea sp.]|uniref:rhodanese-like domain-containing protein n=1 Tax=Zoogloea sp. TaxID=49181 RepID=UPI00262FA397|nr:rhodanese-like domain-containing protein [Zoogloea sp.]MDD3352634.1 rhodanese-like domain-containing protein [Zoogloea sp.]
MLDSSLASAANAIPPAGGSADIAETILENARERARGEGLAYAGGLSPGDAWALVSHGRATLVDVRTAEERKFVGQVPAGLHVAWATGTAMTRNPRFVKELDAKLAKDQVIVFLCRSGKRSVLAAEAAARAGFTSAFNILEGFEGEIDAQQRRGSLGGWRHHGLPWIQD